MPGACNHPRANRRIPSWRWGSRSTRSIAGLPFDYYNREQDASLSSAAPCLYTRPSAWGLLPRA